MIITKWIKIGGLILIILGLFSCKTYYIPIDSFKKQFKPIDSIKLKTVYTRNPLGGVISYKTYSMNYIQCMNKNNKPIKLKFGPSIEIKITKKNNKKITFYLDRIYVKNNDIIGNPSWLIPYKRVVPIDSIKLIEIQDGHKNFKYISNKD